MDSPFMRGLLALRRLLPSFLLPFALISGWVQPVRAQPIAVSTLTLPNGVGGIAWDATRSRFFATSGSNVLMINPETAQVEDTIPVGNPAYEVAVSGDGRYLYVALGANMWPNSLGRVNRYQIQNHALDLQIALDPVTSGNILQGVQAMVVLPGQPSSILVGTFDGQPSDSQLLVYDGAVPRPAKLALSVFSLYVRPSDGSIFGVADAAQFQFAAPQVVWLNVSTSGVAVARSVPVDPSWENNATVTWNGNLVSSRNPFASSVFDLNAGATLGHLPIPITTSQSGSCILSTDNSATSAIVYQYGFPGAANSSNLIQYSLTNFLPVADAAVIGSGSADLSVSSACSGTLTWGPDGLLISDHGGKLFFLHASGFSPLTRTPMPTPTQDASGVIHLALPANGLIYDSLRNVLWASIPGNSDAAGNSVVSIDPATGNVTDEIYAGSEPGYLALSGDGSHLFATLGGAPAIASIDLATRHSSSFSLLDTSSPLYWSAIGVSAIAGQSNSSVAVRSAVGVNSSVIAYDAGIPRKNTFNNGTGANLYTQYVQTIFPADATNAFYAADTQEHRFDGTHDVYRLIVDSTGVKLDKQLNTLLLGSGAAAQGVTAFNQPVSLVYNAGRLFTSAGQILTPDTTQILGSVTLTPAYGLPVALADPNRVMYVQSYSPHISANVYDLGTFRPVMSVPLLTGPPCNCTENTPSAVNVTAAVRAGNSAIAIAANVEIIIAPLASLQPWASASGSVQSVSPGVQQIEIPVRAISSLPGTSKLLLATPSAAGSIGNSIVTFNPDTSQVESATFIGSEPSILSVAPNGSTVYAYVSGERHVARVNIASGTRDLVFAADPTGGSGQYGVFDMAVGSDGGLAVSYPGSIAIGGIINSVFPGGTIAIFDSGAIRPQTDSNTQGPLANDPATFNLAFNDSGSLLYSYNSLMSSFEFKRDAVSAQGLRWLSTTSGLTVGYNTTIRYAGGLLYTSHGEVIDPERLMVVGQFADSWLQGYGDAVAPDLASGRTYFATTSGILIFDSNTHALLARLPISLGPNIFNYPTNLVRFGADGLAFLTSSDEVYLVSISAIPGLAQPIPSPQPPFIAPNGIAPVYSTKPVVESGSWISIYGVNLANSTALWDNDFPTTLAGTSVTIDYRPAYLSYVSPYQINVQVPDDSASGPVPVTVTTASGTATGSVSLSQFAPSLCLFDNQFVAAEILTPDGSGRYGSGTYDIVGPAGQFNFQTRPVKNGETLVLYGTGFGPTNPAVPAGQPFSGAAPTANSVTVTIGGKAATVLFSGIVGPGLYQINVVVPSLPAGDQPVQATVGGANAPIATVAVQ